MLGNPYFKGFPNIVNQILSWDFTFKKVSNGATGTLNVSDSRGVEPRKLLRSSYRFEKEIYMLAKCKQALK